MAGISMAIIEGNVAKHENERKEANKAAA